jgi:hypothetical protein
MTTTPTPETTDLTPPEPPEPPWTGPSRIGFLEALRRGDVGGLIKTVLSDFNDSIKVEAKLRLAMKRLAEYAVELRRQNVAIIGDHDVFVRRTEHGDLRQVVAPVSLSIDGGTLYRIPDRWMKFVKGTDTVWERGLGYPEWRPIYNTNQAKLTAEGYNRINAVAGCSVAQPPSIMVDGQARENPFVQRAENGDLKRIVIGINVAGPAPLTGNIVVVQYTLDLDPRTDLQHMLSNIMQGKEWKNQQDKDGPPKPTDGDDGPAVTPPVRLLHEHDWLKWREQTTQPWDWHWMPLYGGMGLAHQVTHSKVQHAYDKFIGILDNIFRKAQTVARRNAMKAHPALAHQTVIIDPENLGVRIAAVGWTTGDSDIDRYRRALDAIAQGRHEKDIEVIESAEVYDADVHETGDPELDPTDEPPAEEQGAPGELAGDHEELNIALAQLEELVLDLSHRNVKRLGYPPADDADVDAVKNMLAKAIELSEAGEE